MDAVHAKYPDVDPDITWDKFVRYHTNKGTAADKITRALLDGWFKREKPKKDKASTSTVTTTASTAEGTASKVSTSPNSVSSTASETAFMRDMPRVYPLTEKQKADEEELGCCYEVLGLDEAVNWFFAIRNIDRDNPEHEDAFDRALEAAIKNGDVIIADSIGGKCQHGANRTPVMHMEQVSQLKGSKPGKESSFMLPEPFIEKRRIESEELLKIRTMTVESESQGVEFLRELFPDVDTNWLGLLDDCWVFEKI